jgi:large subunit ribosomal protein L31
MKEGIHPTYHELTATCVCGNKMELGSTRDAIRVEICGSCHPYYTGTQKIIDTEGRVDRFVKRYKRNNKAEEAAAN